MSDYRITFDRIGRNRAVPELRVATVDAVTDQPVTDDDLAYIVHTYAGGFMMSRDYTVTCSIDEGHGHIGGGRYGNFTIEKVEEGK